MRGAIESYDGSTSFVLQDSRSCRRIEGGKPRGEAEDVNTLQNVLIFFFKRKSQGLNAKGGGKEKKKRTRLNSTRRRSRRMNGPASMIGLVERRERNAGRRN